MHTMTFHTKTGFDIEGGSAMEFKFESASQAEEVSQFSKVATQQQ